MTDPFLRIHCGLPQEGPGNDAATLEALRRLGPLPEGGTILDLGCGPGRQTLALARATGRRVVAVDLHEPFLEQLRVSAAAAGFSDRIEVRRADMAAPGVPAGSVDLLWSEGAIYILGFARGLDLWRPLLRPGSLVAVTECTWLSDDRPADSVAFWAAAYPAMTTIAENRRIALEAGFAVLDTMTLPTAAWLDDYYGPIERRLRDLRSAAADDPGLAAAIAETEREIDVVRRDGGSFGYVFYLLRREEDR